MTDEDVRQTPPDGPEDYRAIWGTVRKVRELEERLKPLFFLASIMRNWPALLGGIVLVLIIGGQDGLERILNFLRVLQ